MIQTARSDTEARPCDCGRAPQVVRTAGIVARFHLECARCAVRTVRRDSEERARTDWDARCIQSITPPGTAPAGVPCSLSTARSLAVAERERACRLLFDPTPRAAA